MEEIDLAQTKQILVELSEEIKNVCKANNLRYCLAGGTLIGAVRHKGFIPWDDDIDLYMPRPDYEKFLKIFPNSGSENELMSEETNDKYMYPFAKVCKKGTLLIENGGYGGVDIGVYVDIFPIDGLGNSIQEAKAIMKKANPYILLNLGLLVEKNRKNVSFAKNLAVFGCYVLAKLYGGHKKLYRKLKAIATSADYDKSVFVGEFIDETGDKRIVERKLYEEMVELPFENTTFAAPKGYDEILTAFYGDYMTPPPKEKQVLTHGFKAYRLD